MSSHSCAGIGRLCRTLLSPGRLVCWPAKQQGSIGRAVALASGGSWFAVLIATACLSLGTALHSDTRAEPVIRATGWLPVSSLITCARHLPVPLTHSVHPIGRQFSSNSPLREISADLPISKTIVLGTRDSGNALHGALRAARCGVGDLASAALDQPKPTFGVSEREMEINLVVLSAAELGIETEDAPIREIYRRAAQLDYDLCPAEVGPQLRLQYLDQPVGEFLRIAMAPIAIPHGGFMTFIVGNGGAGLILIGSGARPNLIVHSAAKFVFVDRHQARTLSDPRR